jgi:uncharacterized metal-binding protein YceD (DUF177 family)
MHAIFNLRHLENKPLILEGEISPPELNPELADEIIQLKEPVRYRVTVERLPESVLAQGELEAEVDCQCVRCLRPFRQKLVLSDWTCNLPLKGEEAVLVENDCVDLTPFIREDILLAFPQHPVCEANCAGLKSSELPDRQERRADSNEPEGSSAWNELNKLKLKP